MKVIKEIGNKLTLLSNMTDAGWSRQYDFYIIFGQTDPNKSPWVKDNWKSIFEPFLNY
ncbi:MAG: hypothetical protein IPH96_18110 [Saprospiraceae bacterium]|nr:hypothetical protein [Saprospiraceae bacterium]